MITDIATNANVDWYWVAASMLLVLLVRICLRERLK